MNRTVKIALIAAAALALLAANYFLMAEVFFGPPAEVKAALRSDAAVTIQRRDNGGWLAYQPASPIGTGLILYPEGYQDIRMYAPLCRRVAEQGYTVVMLSRREKVPPTFEQEEARVAAARAAFPGVTRWFIGAHTWEANLAAAYALRHEDELAGVVLWAGRLSPETSLAASALPVLNVYGTRDDQNENLVAANTPLLPAGVQWVAIEGGNRVGFANFGPMPRDVGASISPQEQQAQAAAATVEFMR